MLIAIDFDECLIESHLSADFTARFAKLQNLSHIPDDLADLLTLYQGAPATVLSDLAQSVAQEAVWREGAEAFLKTLLANPAQRVVILSSGLDLPIAAFLKRYDLSPLLHCCSLSFEDGLCSGTRTLITAHNKKSFVAEAIAQDGYANVLTIGHGHGDLEMMTISRSLCIPGGYAPCEAVAWRVSNHFDPALLADL